MTATQKMKWLVDKLMNNKGDFIIANTHEKKGTIVIPTGGGKSGVIYEDIAYHIKKAEPGQKIIFHISCPILKLAKQLSDDGMVVFSVLFNDLCNDDRFMFFLNSSANGRVYDIEGMNMDCDRFINIDRFKNSKKAQFAFVISCHKSLPKFAEKIDELNSFATVITYLDEAHLVLNETRDDKDYKHLNSEGKKRWDSLTELCKGEYIYALTATPDLYVTENINKSKGENNGNYLINVPAQELIKNNIILPSRIYFGTVDNSDGEKITFEICDDFMTFVTKDNPYIYHKVLITCRDYESLIALREKLSTKYKVFSTCAKEGAKFIGLDEDGNEEYAEIMDIDETEFIKEVDEYDGDCFVLHIKQLRQGIDIKSLTDIIFYNSTRVNNGVKRTIVQTLGRAIRPAMGERGMAEELRTKKYANALFLVSEKDEEAVKRQMFTFLLSYYGLKSIQAFTIENKNHGGVGQKHGMFDFGRMSDEYCDEVQTFIKEFKVEMGKYIESVVMPRYRIFLSYNGGKPNPALIPHEIATMRRKFSNYYGEVTMNELFQDSEFLNSIYELFAKLGIAI